MKHNPSVTSLLVVAFLLLTSSRSSYFASAEIANSLSLPLHHEEFQTNVRNSRSDLLFSNPKMLDELFNIIVDVISSLDECSLVFVMEDAFSPFIDKLSTFNQASQSTSEKKFEDFAFTPYEIYFLPKTTNQDLDAKLKLSMMESCSHYIFFTVDQSLLLDVLQTILASMIELNDKFIIVSPDSNWIQETNSNISLSSAATPSGNFVQKSPANKLVNILHILMYPAKKSGSNHLTNPLTSSPMPQIQFYTNAFFKNGKRFAEVFLGTWKSGKMIKSKDVEQIFPDFYSSERRHKWFPVKLRDFERFLMQVSTFNYPPVVIFGPNSDRDPTETADGLEVRLLRALSQSLNFDFRIATPKDGDKWGKELPDGSWTGAFGEVLRGDADISFANYFITEERLLLVDMTNPYHIDYTCFITPMPAPLAKFTVVARPFQNSIWAVIFCSLIVLPVVMRVSSFLEESLYFSSVWNALLFIWGLVLSRSMPHHTLPKTSTLRILYTFCAISFLSLGVAYMTCLFSMLVLPSRGIPVNSLSELLHSGLQWGVRDSGGWEKWFSNSIDPTAQQIAAGFHFVTGIEAGISRVKEGNFAFMNSGTFLRYLVASNFTDEFGQKQLHITKECFVPFRIGLAVPHSSVYTYRFNEVINRVVEAGLVNQWFRDLLEMAAKNQRSKSSDDAPLQDSDESSLSDTKVLKMYDLQGAFYLLLLGYCASVITALVEYLFHKGAKKLPKKKADS